MAQKSLTLTLSIEKDSYKSHNSFFRLTILSNNKPVAPGMILSGKDTTLHISLLPAAVYDFYLEHESLVYNRMEISSDTLARESRLYKQFTLKVITLKEVIVTQMTPYYKGDTLIIPVGSIKTRPYSAATELLNKIPGFDAGPTGEVKVKGKKVEEITVNGQRLFGGNAKATLEAIKSDMVQQVEVVERENSSGEKVPSLNLRLKKSRSRGWYGDITAMGANADRRKTDLRLNFIKPKFYFNSFLNHNNVNEKSLSEQSLFSFINSFKKDIAAHSITEQQGQGNISVIRIDDNLFQSYMNKYGSSNSVSGGASMSNIGKKNAADAFILAESNDRSLMQDYYGSSFITPFIQTDSSRTIERNKRFNLLANIGFRTPAHTRNSFKMAQTVRFSAEDISRNTDTRNSLYNADNNTLLKNLITATSNPYNRKLSFINQGMWLHRFKKTAKVFSAYTRYEYEKNDFEHTYYNTGLGSNRQSVSINATRQLAELQLVQSFPLNKSLLFELRSNNQYDRWNANQSSFNYDSASGLYNRFLPFMSAAPLFINNFRTQNAGTLLFKKSSHTLVTGLSLFYWQSLRQYNNEMLARENKILLLPFVLYKRKLPAGSSIILQYKPGWDIPNNDQLTPLPDSSSIQQVRTGNPLLDGAFRHVFGATFSNNSKAGNLLSATTQIIYISNPVINETATDPRGKIGNTLAQYGSARQVNTSLFWLRFNASKPFTAFSSLVISAHSSYAVNNNIPFKFTSIFGSFYFGGKWKINKNAEADIKWRVSYNNYSSTQNSRSDLRNTLMLTVENSLPKEWYTTVGANIQFNGSNSPEARVNSFLRVDAAKYFSKNNRLRLLASVRNIFNINKSITFSQTATLQSINRYNTLPRLFTLSFTYFFDKWTGKG